MKKGYWILIGVVVLILVVIGILIMIETKKLDKNLEGGDFLSSCIHSVASIKIDKICWDRDSGAISIKVACKRENIYLSGIQVILNKDGETIFSKNVYDSLLKEEGDLVEVFYFDKEFDKLKIAPIIFVDEKEIVCGILDSVPIEEC